MELPSWRTSCADAYPVAYFLSGGLTDAKILKGVLELDEEPRLKIARIRGFQVLEMGAVYVLARGDEWKSQLLTGKEEELREEVEGVVYMVSSTKEKVLLADYLTSCYGVGCSKDVAVDIEIIAQGMRRSRKLEGRTFVYTGTFSTSPADDPGNRDKRTLADPPCTGPKELRRKPVPIPTSSPMSSTIVILPRSPSLNLPTVQPRPASYHGASITSTQAMLSERKKAWTNARTERGRQASEVMETLKQEIAVLSKEITSGPETVLSKAVHSAAFLPFRSLQAEPIVPDQMAEDVVEKSQDDAPAPLFSSARTVEEFSRRTTSIPSSNPPCPPAGPGESPMCVQWSFSSGSMRKGRPGKPLPSVPEEQILAVREQPRRRPLGARENKSVQRKEFHGDQYGNGYEADAEK